MRGRILPYSIAALSVLGLLADGCASAPSQEASSPQPPTYDCPLSGAGFPPCAPFPPSFYYPGYPYGYYYPGALLLHVVVNPPPPPVPPTPPVTPKPVPKPPPPKRSKPNLPKPKACHPAPGLACP